MDMRLPSSKPKDMRSTSGWTFAQARREDAAMDELHALGVAAVFVLAGGVKGVTGMGLPTVAVSLLGLWMAPVQAAALLVAPSLATNVAQCRGPHARRLLAMLWPAWLALAIVTVWAPEASGTASPIGARRLLGSVLVAYGLWGLWRPALADLSRQATWVGAIAGGATGFVTAATAVFVIPLVPYLQALRLDKDAMVQALGLSFTVATLALAVRLQASDALVLLSAPSALALAAAFVGLWLGTAVRSRISGPAFQRALFLVFTGLGAANLLRGS
jgi:uncharacterized membrane protein YfcA